MIGGTKTPILIIAYDPVRIALENYREFKVYSRPTLSLNAPKI